MKLFYHPESDCLFWHDGEQPDPLCNEVGESSAASESQARLLWSLLPSYDGKPKFEDVYRAPKEAEPPPVLAEVKDGKALEEPRWKGGPRICVATNMPAFETVKEAKAFNEANGHPPILASWKCAKCGCYHYWSGAPSSPTGDVKTGSHTIPKRITRLIEQTKI